MSLLARILLSVGLALLLSSCEVQPTLSSFQHVVVGIVTTSEGYPKVTRKNRNYILARQSRIFQNDIIHTDKESRLTITMLDDTTFSIGTDSHFVLHQYDFDAAPLAEMSLTSGSLRVQTKTKSPRQRFQLKTPLAVVRTPGADFWSGFTIGENTLEIAMIEGQPTVVENDHGTIQLAQDGWGTTVIGNSAPQPPKSWSNQKIEQALVKTNLLSNQMPQSKPSNGQ